MKETRKCLFYLLYLLYEKKSIYRIHWYTCLLLVLFESFYELRGNYLVMSYGVGYVCLRLMRGKERGRESLENYAIRVMDYDMTIVHGRLCVGVGERLWSTYHEEVK